MQSFEYHCPTEIIFGKGAELKAADKIKKYGGTKVLVVYGGGSVVRSGLLQKITDLLQTAKLPYETLGGVQPNPRLELARTGVQQANKFKADFILAVGGGSVIDTSKAIAHGRANPDTDIWDFWSGKAELTKSLPVGVVLTISAAGSETSNSAVLTNEETGKKAGINTDFNRPCFAVMNPELTYTLPERQIACGVTDIMMHTLDRYFTHTKGNEMTDAIAEALLKNVAKNGRIALAKHDDYEAMSEIMWCGSLSHNGLTGLGAEIDFATHKLGHELSGKFDVPHGASLSALWASWARYVYKEEPQRFAIFAERVWGIHHEDLNETALAGIAATEAYFASIHMPTNFSELGIGKQDEKSLQYLADRCSDYGKKTVANFKKLTREDMYNIYKMANK
ncbi:iron-containing alcohol dehydrogenase [Propionispira raffinosivorans]|uniref:iron-containing alcohol dehydrogenase n=1 Tax=Propionispira raffinosivorans TaxID=86959 RepID=UPI0003709A1D|nr:iron-containing alcohol dehydrogenase [Propionispira raffinosivorans]